jgi:hypothetical protein
MQRTFMERIQSRKFLLAIGAALTMAGTGNYSEAAAVVVAYLAGESYVDSKSVY